MGFLVSVKGGRAPNFVHEEADAALVEALRLQGSLATQNGYSPEIQILQQVMVLPHRQRGQVLDFSAVQIKDYSVKVRAGTMLHVFNLSQKPL